MFLLEVIFSAIYVQKTQPLLKILMMKMKTESTSSSTLLGPKIYKILEMVGLYLVSE
jgi:hypothetical protein